VRRLSIPIGRVLGVRLSLHASWFLVFGLVVWVTVSEFNRLYPRLGEPTRLAMGLLTGIAFFVCLTAHELAHSVVARRFGIRVRGITLFMFGGVAEIEGEVPSPSREFAIALVGPATSVLLGGVFALLAEYVAELDWPAAEGVLGTLALVNLGIALFNLVPGLPLDGGRILRAALWRLTGDYFRATRIASVGGRLLVVALGGLGVFLALTGDLLGLWYVPMAVFLWFLVRSVSRHSPPPSRPALALGDREDQASGSGP
jgi:Zn-dependent protease